MPTERNQLREHLYQLTKGETENWQQVLEFVQQLDLFERRKYVWAWPHLEQLNCLTSTLSQLKIDCLLSVGCGNGLFEWLVQQSSGMQLFGLEVDRQWWQSKYAVNNFIPLNYAEDACIELGQFLQLCCHKTDWNFALFFCYFNNRKAFLDYLQAYGGKWLIIVSPKPSLGIHTDPSALDPQFPINSSWRLQQQIDIGVQDVLAIYANLLL